MIWFGLGMVCVLCVVNYRCGWCGLVRVLCRIVSGWCGVLLLLMIVSMFVGLLFIGNFVVVSVVLNLGLLLVMV